MIVEIKKTEDGFLDFPSMAKAAMLKGALCYRKSAVICCAIYASI